MSQSFLVKIYILIMTLRESMLLRNRDYESDHFRSHTQHPEHQPALPKATRSHSLITKDDLPPCKGT